jgi:ribosomal protein L21
VGRLEGELYDSQGQPTETMDWVQSQISEAQIQANIEKEQRDAKIKERQERRERKAKEEEAARAATTGSEL